jgi:hypothetical protein
LGPLMDSPFQGFINVSPGTMDQAIGMLSQA